MEHLPPEPRSSLLLFGSWAFSGLYFTSRDNITFLLSTAVTVLAAINYFLQIRKNLRK